MNLRTVTLISGVLGGLCWVARMVAALAGADEGPLLDTLHWGGLALLAVGLAGFGVSMVSRSAVWLRVIVAVAFPLLVWSVLEALHPAGDPAVIDGVFGLVALAVALRAARRGRGDGGDGRRGERSARQRQAGRHGSHAR